MDRRGREELQYIEGEDNITIDSSIAGFREDISGENVMRVELQLERS
jgi:hypothetical protein